MQPKIVFLKTEWMRRYDGRDTDSIGTTMGFPKKFGIGHEILNFRGVRGTTYGYSAPKGGRKLDLTSLGASREATQQDGVTIVWVARQRGNAGTRVVGWYENATVFREYRKHPLAKRYRDLFKSRGLPVEHRDLVYLACAASKDCHLIPEEDRNLELPRRKMENTLIWYADKSARFKKRVLDLIAQRRGRRSDPEVEPPVSGPIKCATSEWGLKPERRRRAAAHLVKEHNNRKKVLGFKDEPYVCDGCGESPEVRYGTGFDKIVEVHHTKWAEEKRIEDFAVLCPSCHRRVHFHRAEAPLSIQDLRRELTLVRKQR